MNSLNLFTTYKYCLIGPKKSKIKIKEPLDDRRFTFSSKIKNSNHLHENISMQDKLINNNISVLCG